MPGQSGHGRTAPIGPDERHLFLSLGIQEGGLAPEVDEQHIHLLETHHGREALLGEAALGSGQLVQVVVDVHRARDAGEAGGVPQLGLVSVGYGVQPVLPQGRYVVESGRVAFRVVHLADQLLGVSGEFKPRTVGNGAPAACAASALGRSASWPVPRFPGVSDSDRGGTAATAAGPEA